MNGYQKPALGTSHLTTFLFSVGVSLGMALLWGWLDEYAIGKIVATFFYHFFSCMSVLYIFPLYDRAKTQKMSADFLTSQGVHPIVTNALHRGAWSDGKIILAILSFWILIFGAIWHKIIAQGRLGFAEAVIAVTGTLFLIGCAAMVIRKFRIKA